jgi:hypothetical protein
MDSRDVVFMAKGLQDYLIKVTKEVRDHSIHLDSSCDLLSANESQAQKKKEQAQKIDGKYLDKLQGFVEEIKNRAPRNEYGSAGQYTSYI